MSWSSFTQDSEVLVFREELIRLGKFLPQNSPLFAHFSAPIPKLHEKILSSWDTETAAADSLRYLSTDLVVQIVSHTKPFKEDLAYDFLVSSVPIPGGSESSNTLLYDLGCGMRRSVSYRKDVPSRGLWVNYEPLEFLVEEQTFPLPEDRNNHIGVGISDDLRRELIHTMSLVQFYACSIMEVQPLLVRLLNEGKTLHTPMIKEQVDSLLRSKRYRNEKELERATLMTLNLVFNKLLVDRTIPQTMRSTMSSALKGVNRAIARDKASLGHHEKFTMDKDFVGRVPKEIAYANYIKRLEKS